MNLECILILVLKIIAPSWDVYSDLYFSIVLYSLAQPIFATLLLAPFLVNYFLTWICWGKLDKKKHFTWIFPLLACYPQYCAGKIILMMYKEKPEALDKKKKMERETGDFEVLEAVCSTIVLSSLLQFSMVTEGNDETVITGDNWFLFVMTWTSSIFSAAFGLANCLKVGPCRILPEGGKLGGLWTFRFFILAIIMFYTLGSKICVAGVIFGEMKGISPVLEIVIYSCTMVLPNLVVAMVSLSMYDKDCLKSIIRYPSLLFIPVFSPFTFSTNTSSCTKMSGEDDEETWIALSRTWTIVNSVMSGLGFIGFTVVFFLLTETSQFGLALYFGSLVLIMLSIIFTIVYPCIETTLEYGVLMVNDPLVEYVKDDEGNVVERQN